MAVFGRRLLPATTVIVASLAGFGAVSRVEAALPCGGAFTIVHRDRIFDGVRLGIMVFQSAEVAFLTDTFGAWLPREGEPGEALVLRHRTMPGASLAICALPRDQAPMSESNWESLLRALVDQSGGRIQILETRDSENDIGATRALGWHTREVVLREPSENGEGFVVERRLFAANDAHAVLFRLSVPEAAQKKVSADLRFFIARLERI